MQINKLNKTALKAFSGVFLLAMTACKEEVIEPNPEQNSNCNWTIIQTADSYLWDYDGDGQGDCEVTSLPQSPWHEGIDQNGDGQLDYDPNLDQDGNCIPDNLESNNCNWTIIQTANGYLWDYDGDGQGDCEVTSLPQSPWHEGIDQDGNGQLDYDPNLDQNGNCIPDNLENDNCNWTIIDNQMWDYDGDGQGDCNLNYDANGGIVGIDQNGDTVLDYDPSLDQDGDCIPDNLNSSNCNWTILWGQMWDYDGDGQGDCNLNFDANGGIVGIDQNGDTILDYDPNLDLNGNCIPDSVE